MDFRETGVYSPTDYLRCNNALVTNDGEMMGLFNPESVDDAMFGAIIVYFLIHGHTTSIVAVPAIGSKTRCRTEIIINIDTTRL